MPELGEKSPEYPFGYGWCGCGCGRATKLIGGVYLKFFHGRHNPERRRIAHDLAVRRVKKAQAQAEMPVVRQPTAKAVASVKKNQRLAQAVAWTKANQEFIQWHRKNLRAKSNETARRYHRDRRQRDPVFKLLAYVRGRIRGSLKRKNIGKSAKTEKLLGCSVEDLKKHLEGRFRAGMSWDNYGQWHVDHIKPCCSFDLTKPEEQAVCFHYTNLQPLWAEENHRKSGRYLPKSKMLQSAL